MPLNLHVCFNFRACLCLLSRKHAALTKKRSLPLYLHRKEPGDDDDEDDDDEEEEDDGNESDFGYLPGDEPLGNSGNSGSGDVVMSRNNRHSGKRNNKGVSTMSQQIFGAYLFSAIVRPGHI